MTIVLAAVLVVLGAAALSVVGFLLISRYVPQRFLVANADGASTVYATIGMVYAILIAIAAIAVWEPRSAAGDGTEQEAEALVEAHWAASTLGPSDRSAIQGLIVSYLKEASEGEWRYLREHRTGTAEGDEMFTRLRERISTVQPSGDQEIAAQQQLLGYASQAATARMSRLSTAGEGIPPLLWWTLVLGGLVSVLFLYLFGLERTVPNGVMLAALGGMLALLLFVIYQVEYPFSRGFAVEPDSLRGAITQLTR